MARERGDEYVRFLEDQVHRLNVELARKQRGEPLGEAASDGVGGPVSTVPPAFLLDDVGLPPLIHAYEQQVNVPAAAIPDHVVL